MRPVGIWLYYITNEIGCIEQRDNVTIAGILPVCSASEQTVTKVERKQILRQKHRENSIFSEGVF